MLYYNKCEGKCPRGYYKEVTIMLYNIYFDGELLSTELSFMDACLYLSEHCLSVREENEIQEQDDGIIVELYCAEA